MLAVLFYLDPAFFYPRIETDQLLYLLKAKALVETGSTSATIAVNAPPFSYAAMPGVLRAPFMVAFGEFDQQLRAIQVMNVVIVTLSALMGAYILSWAVPARAHPAAIVFAFIFVILSPDWLANTFVPLADAPYAMLTFACLILAVRILVSPNPIMEHKKAIVAFVFLFIVAFMVRFTAPVLLVPLAILARGRWSGNAATKRQRLLIAALPLIVLAALTVLNADAIFRKYAMEPFHFLATANKTGIALNLLASAMPAQIIPVFNLAYQVTPPTHPLNPAFGTTPRDLVLVLIGLAISATTIFGLARSARRFLPEIAYLAVILPVLAVMMPSTTRYLISYQPILWIGFAVGAARITAPVRSRISVRQARGLAVAAAMLAIGGIVLLRSARTARTASMATASSGILRPVSYAEEVATTFRSLRDFLEGLPADKTLLVTGRGEAGRWDVIAGRRNYLPDLSLETIVAEKDVYSVLSCGTPMSCQYFDVWYELRKSRLASLGSVRLEKVFDVRTGSARAAVYKVSSAQAPDGAGPQSASGLTAR